jgi:hypothetical protein
MSLLSNISFRKILVIFLVQVTLFLGLAFGSGNYSQASAQVLNRKTTSDSTQNSFDEAKYEEAKARRREIQAERSEQAAEDTANENIAEKLNLDESVPKSTKKFVKQIQGKEPIIDKTEPSNAEDYTTPRAM